MPEQPNDQDSSSEEAGFSQEDIDAMMNGGAENAPGDDASGSSGAFGDLPADDVADAASGDVDQASIDALLGGGDEGAESPDSEPEAGPQAVNQSDIDALVNSAADESEDAAAEADARVDTPGRPFDEAAAAMQAAIDEENAAAQSSPATPDPAPTAAPFVPAAAPSGSAPIQLPELGDSAALSESAKRVSMLNDVALNVRLQLGQTTMLVEDVLALGEGSVVELDKLAGDPVDVLVNNRLIARGEVLVLNDSFCVRISEVLTNDPHRITA